MKGEFISVEGIDGSGKTTFVNRLAEECTKLNKTEKRFSSIYSGHLFDITPYGKALRLDLKTRSDMSLEERRERIAYMYTLHNVFICNWLAAGELVILDRYVDSFFAYEGYYEEAYEMPIRMPDMTVFIDAPVDVAAKNRGLRGVAPDVVERADRAQWLGISNAYVDAKHEYYNRIYAVDYPAGKMAIERVLERVGLLKVEY